MMTETIEFVNMNRITMNEAKNIVDNLSNQLELKIGQIKLARNNIDIKALNYDKDVVDGGKRIDLMLEYVGRIEEIQRDIDNIRKLICLYECFITKELKRLEKYDEWEQYLIYHHIELNEPINSLLYKVPFSRRTCYRIVEKYKKEKLAQIGTK